MAVALLAAAVAAGAGAAYATTSGDDGVIRGCYGNAAGSLRVLDSASKECTRAETPISWNQRGPRGETGPPGPAGPAGPPGPALASIDQLDGIRCKGVRGKPATVRVGYGSGLEAPLSLSCITHLVANPGPFTIRVDSGTLAFPLLGTLPLPTSGWHLAGEIDLRGHIEIPGPAFQLDAIPFEGTIAAGSFGNVRVVGTISLASTALSGELDPEPGAASLGGGVYGTVTLDATGQLAGQTSQLYAGTCALGSAASPLPITLTTTPPGVPYSQTNGAATLTSALASPPLEGCSPAMPAVYAFLLDLFAGNGRLTFAGTSEPVLKAT